MNEEVLKQTKEIFRQNEHLFAKLHKVGRQYEEIDFDESGLYEEDEERTLRHWNKLTEKLAAALQSGLEEIEVAVKKCMDPAEYKVSFIFTSNDGEDKRSDTVKVDYSNEGEISITA